MMLPLGARPDPPDLRVQFKGLFHGWRVDLQEGYAVPSRYDVALDTADRFLSSGFEKEASLTSGTIYFDEDHIIIIWEAYLMNTLQRPIYFQSYHNVYHNHVF